MPVNLESTNLTEEDYKQQLEALLANCNQDYTIAINKLLPDVMQYHVECTNEPSSQQQSLPTKASGKSTKLAQYIYDNSDAIKGWKKFRESNEKSIKGNHNQQPQTSNDEMKEALTKEINSDTNTNSPQQLAVRSRSWSSFFCIPLGDAASNTLLLPPPPPPPPPRLYSAHR